MSCIQQQSPTAIHGGRPALRIDTEVSGLGKASFEDINSAPVTKKELGLQDVVQHQYSPSVAFTSNNWRSTMAVPPCPPGTGSSTEDPSPERIFSNEDGIANTSGSSEHRVSPVNQGVDNGSARGSHGCVSPLISETSSNSTSGESSGTPAAVREAALARIISHGYAKTRPLNGRAPDSTDRVDIFEVLPAVLDAQGRAVCQHHAEHGICDCEAFPLVKINFPLPMPRSNRVCYPIQEVDESPAESQPAPDAELTPNASPATAAKLREENEKRQLEAQRFEGLLGKLRRSAEDKCNKLIKEWKDPVTGRSEPLGSWDKETYLAWSRRLDEYKDLVRKKYTPGKDSSAAVDEQSVSSVSTGPKEAVQTIMSPSKPSPTGLQTKLPGPKIQTWNPKAQEFLPVKDPNPAGEAAGARVREMLSQFVNEAKRNAARDNDKKSTKPAGATAPPAPFVTRMANAHYDTFTSPFSPTPSFAQMVPGVTPFTFSAFNMADPSLGSLATPGLTPGLGASKFDFNPLNGIGTSNPTLGAGLSGVSNVGNPGLSGLTGFNLGVQRPFSQTLSPADNTKPPAPTRAPPGPVPKPRIPNPQAQQQYEQWIEWRKANEPGYALECKARQARRAQRTKATTTSSLKSEARPVSSANTSSETRSGESKAE